MGEQTEVERFPAALIVHWPTGPVYCCNEHGDGLVKLGQFMGAYTPVQPYDGPEPCSNCVNEAKTTEK